jgi:raffinose/stachyose/melibiose transport system substrate-binding protein
MRKRHITVGAILVTGALLLAGCSSTGVTTTKSGIDTSPSGKGKTLTLWDYEGDTSAMGIAWKAAIPVFEKETGAKVKFEAKSFQQIQSTASQVLNSNSAPDVMEYNKGNATAGLLSSEGLLTNLNAAVKAYGWDKLLSSSLQTTAKYNAKGIMGSGNFFGVPNYGEFVMAYYNQDAFTKYGISVPTTFAEFEKALATFKSHGITPLAESSVEYPLGQLWYQLALSHATRQWVNNYQTYAGKVDFHDADFTFAANTLKDWVSKGYISQNANGQKAQDAGDSFQNGTSPIFYSGSWWYGTFISGITKFKWGTFLFPGSTMAPGSSGNLWVVPTKSKNKDLAYKFIDITMSKKIQNLMGNSGGIPVAADASAITGVKNKELIANFNTLTKRDGLAFYPDWPTSTFYDQINTALQKLIDGAETPTQFLAELGGEYATGVKQITG